MGCILICTTLPSNRAALKGLCHDISLSTFFPHQCSHLTLIFLFYPLGFPGSSAGKEPACNAGRPQFNSQVEKICWRRGRPPTPVFLGFPGGSAGKESTCNVGDLGSIPGLGRFPGEGNGYSLQYSGLENSMDCVVHGVAKSRT